MSIKYKINLWFCICTLGACSLSNGQDATVGNDAERIEQQERKRIILTRINEIETELAYDRSFSDSQDFETITTRESIEDNSKKLTTLASRYRQFGVEPLPLRKENINLAAYAMINRGETVGERRYQRNLENYKTNHCQNYIDVNLAQFTFLSKGGPEQDLLFLDPDGDGFVCGWRPQF